MTPANSNDPLRWKIEATYRYDAGPRTETFYLDELEDLSHAVEEGPDWDALVDIRITLHDRSKAEDWTVEQSQAA